MCHISVPAAGCPEDSLDELQGRVSGRFPLCRGDSKTRTAGLFQGVLGRWGWWAVVERLGWVSLDLTSLPLVSPPRVSSLRASVSSLTPCSRSCSWSSYGNTLASKCQPDLARDTWAMLSHRRAEFLGRAGRAWAPLLLGLGPS